MLLLVAADWDVSPSPYSQNPHKEPHEYPCALNYSQQEPSDRFTLQPGGMNIHTLKLPSAVSSRLRLTASALTHICIHSTTPLHRIHAELVAPAEVGQWVNSRGGGTPRS